MPFPIAPYANFIICFVLNINFEIRIQLVSLEYWPEVLVQTQFDLHEIIVTLRLKSRDLELVNQFKIGIVKFSYRSFGIIIWLKYELQGFVYFDA